MKAISRLGFWVLLLNLCCGYFLIVNAGEMISSDPVTRLGLFYPPLSESIGRADVVVSFVCGYKSKLPVSGCQCVKLS